VLAGNEVAKLWLVAGCSAVKRGSIGSGVWLSIVRGDRSSRGIGRIDYGADATEKQPISHRCVDGF